jgi:hypothetical protein
MKMFAAIKLTPVNLLLADYVHSDVLLKNVRHVNGAVGVLVLPYENVKNYQNIHVGATFGRPF